MANLKSAIKRIDTNNKKHDLNKSVKSDMRTHIRHVEKLVEANDLDKAVQKGVIHRNNGNRQKARLSKKINSLSA